jgi:hypothetical protein
MSDDQQFLDLKTRNDLLRKYPLTKFPDRTNPPTFTLLETYSGSYRVDATQNVTTKETKTIASGLSEEVGRILVDALNERARL